MRESDRQKSRDARALAERSQRSAEFVVKAAQKRGGRAQATTDDRAPGVVGFEAQVASSEKAGFVRDVLDHVREQ